MIQGFPKKINPQGKVPYFTDGYNQAIDECESAVMKMLDKEKIGGVLQLRYFKLMHPEITESDAKIVANVLAQAIVDYMKGGV